MNQLTFRPRKSLGQNFLVDENVARKIIRALAPTPNDVIVEIGPGFGVLTKYLIREAKKVVGIEIDRTLAENLRSEFGTQSNFELIVDDFLKVDLAELVPAQHRVRVAGNIPYHITSPVIFKIFKHRQSIFDMTLMIQKEVARRIVAKPGGKDYGILSVYSQLFSQPRLLFQVSKNVFRPRPEVDSAVVHWNFSNAPRYNIKSEDILDRLVHGVFQQRRKMLRKSLRSIPEFVTKLETLGTNLERRPEELTPIEFVDLSNQLS